MLKNNDSIEEFKRSLSATVKSIGKKEDLEINYVKENPSIAGNTINLTEPNIENLKYNLNYLRAEADSLALEFRLHSKEIHQSFINNDEFSNEILDALEQTRIEVKGSKEFKGIGQNIRNKHLQDLKKNRSNKSKDNLINAFRYVSYEELTNQKLSKENDKYRMIIKEKLKNNYSVFFNELKKHLNNQEKFTETILEKLEELGLLNKKNNNLDNEELNENEIDENQENNENENNSDDDTNDANIEMQSSKTDIEQALSVDKNEDMGDDSSDTETDYLPKIE